MPVETLPLHTPPIAQDATHLYMSALLVPGGVGVEPEFGIQAWDKPTHALTTVLAQFPIANP